MEVYMHVLFVFMSQLNFKNGSLWAGKYVWHYSKTFSYPLPTADDVVLVFDGIKMGASVSLNGVSLGVVTDQFVRTNFTVTHLLSDSNTLSVRFNESAHGRWMACSGGWDWGPYSNTFEGADHTFSRGIV